MSQETNYYNEDRRRLASNGNQRTGTFAPRGGPPPIPRRNHLWIGAPQQSIPRDRFLGAARQTPSRERFSGPAQGDDEDWPPDAPISIAETTAVAKTYGDVAEKTSRGKSLDIHELLKKEAFASPSEACDNHFEKSRPCPDDVYGTSDQYVVLDSWVKDLGRSAPAKGAFSWNFMVQGVSHDQNVGVKDRIDTVVAVQIGAFTIPTIVPGQQMTNPFNGQTIPGFPLLVAGYQIFGPPDPGATMGYTFGYLSPYVGRITIELQEIGLQSISQRGGIRYHFEADVIPVFPTQGTISTALGGSAVAAINPEPQALRVVPLPGFDSYIFTEPIQDIHGLTLIFRAVDQILPFPQDVVLGVTAISTLSTWPFLALSIPLSGEDYAPTSRWLLNNTGLTRIFITGLQTGNAPIDNWVNQTPGLLSQLPSAAVPGIGINSFDFGSSVDQQNITIILAPKVNISPLVPVAPPAGTTVVIHSKTPVTIRFSAARIRIPCRFRRVVQRLTNYGA